MPIKLSTTDNPRDFLPQARTVIGESRKAHPPIYKQYMNEVKDPVLIKEWENMGGFGDFPIQDEGDYPNFAKPDKGNTFRTQTDKRQLAICVTEQDRRFNENLKVQELLKRMSRAATRTQERIAAIPFNLAFSTARLTIDGQPLLSSNHVRNNGMIVSNRPVTPVDLTQSSLEAALVQFSLLRDEDGTYVDVAPRYLLVHPSELPNAQRVVGAANIFTGSTQGNVPNAADTGVANTYIRGYNLTVISNPYLNDPDAWFLLGDKDDNGLYYWENLPLGDRNFQDPFTEDWVYSMAFAAVAFATHSNSVYGSEGA